MRSEGCSRRGRVPAPRRRARAGSSRTSPRTSPGRCKRARSRRRPRRARARPPDARRASPGTRRRPCGAAGWAARARRTARPRPNATPTCGAPRPRGTRPRRRPRAGATIPGFPRGLEGTPPGITPTHPAIRARARGRSRSRRPGTASAGIPAAGRRPRSGRGAARAGDTTRTRSRLAAAPTRRWRRTSEGTSWTRRRRCDGTTSRDFTTPSGCWRRRWCCRCGCRSTFGGFGGRGRGC
mmetsp:Transcript_14752/g.57878  ORF Transcript_14752/g.57878 Transcript_14752/m.57878 type:complete len:239 (+) Transcript_14752:229-945(+)